MDPGNWATDIEAGSRSGYDLLFVVLLCGLAAMLLQTLALRLGITGGHDLARMAREHYRPTICRALWVLAEIAIIATDLAEVLGSALAFKLLLSVPLWIGVLTGLDTMLVLAFQNRAMRKIEAIMLGLILTIGLCFAAQLVIAPPSLSGILHGSVPRTAALTQPHALYLAVGILGATVMPHISICTAPSPANDRLRQETRTYDWPCALPPSTSWSRC
jgi:manganese transport protein